ncbi:GNAT family N-acetyltransferase [Methylovulum miyakonense]|uniref:GNAT family N-acetyltransferase n=1 Tax=Methylovulum miyakonense TaxID=645578 RepID=UPI000365F844|nr:GNAT family N-acetyltransferase [Methylovulum miyakonense]
MRILNVPATDQLLGQFRTKYLEYIYEPQDLHSEFLNRDAASYILWQGNEAVGHFLIAGTTLLEFYAIDERLAEPAFDHVLHARFITRAICKTFDPMILSLSLGRAVQAKPISLHFTTIADTSFRQNQSITVRPARVSDLVCIRAINDGFFDSDEEVSSYIEKSHLLLYEENNNLLGCGLVQPVIEGRSFYDLGMLVNPFRRRQGVGEYIVRHLKARCLSRGLRPICCCGIENLASRACLEAAGFRSRHRTIEFSF